MAGKNVINKMFSWGDLSQMSALMGFGRLSNQKNKVKGVLKGQFHYQKFPGGLSLHYGSTLELEDSSNSTELPAGISFTLVMKGNASFAIAGERYSLRENARNPAPECCAIIIKKPDVLTRFLARNTQVTKLNIFLEKRWIQARCNHDGQDELSQLFNLQNKVIHWQPSKELTEQVQSVFTSSINGSLAGRLAGESMTLALADKFVRELLGHAVQSKMKAEIDNKEVQQDSLHFQLLQFWIPGMSLEKIASGMHMSVSTLQRKFKEMYGITVMDYLRTRSLEKARLNLLERRISVGEAAFIAGYKHPSNFISAFKRSFGLTPKQLLEAHSNS
ncbi:helix-turn-helix transcriptional regulator [Gammaproteobacteria bacterium]|nr:helix-turn-helix transcriptional regulator [Gammaproteobacteria bacterium]